MSRRQIPIPLSAEDDWALLEVTLPLTEEQWQQMMAMLSTMKSGLVQTEAPSSAGGGGADNDGR